MKLIESIYEMTALQELGRHPTILLMLGMACLLLYLGIHKKFEPLLLVPIAFGVLLANFPGGNMGVISEDELVAKLLADEHFRGMVGSYLPGGQLEQAAPDAEGRISYEAALEMAENMEPAAKEAVMAGTSLLTIAKKGGILSFLYYALIKTGFLPPIIFMGVGALTDFGPMLRNLRLAFFGAAAQIGIFAVLFGALFAGFSMQEAAALGIIGGADGPTAIYTTILLAPHLLGPIAIAAYSYMALVPVIIPFVVKFTMNKGELAINMKKMDERYPPKLPLKNPRKVKLLFPVLLGMLVALMVPSSVPLVGMLLFGNLIKEAGSMTERLHRAASGPILNVATIFLGLTVGATMTADAFVNPKTLMIVLGGFVAFAISIAGGILAVKIYNLFAQKKINPLVGATGLSAVPMASRVANELALRHDRSNHILQYCMASNISGVIGSAVAAGVLISFLS
ncbi:MAG: sodium ion-translocating decarboxylase subunit beta [Bacteroidetes bacterium]|nr:MAG: sodium ion-translocating decarboxylase subunit beta [Bacteroidota bacterium]